MACQAVAAADFSGPPAFVPRTGLQRGILRLRGAAAKDGGAEGIRTPDPHNAIVVLYQLSYDPIRQVR